jgi:S-layer protein
MTGGSGADTLNLTISGGPNAGVTLPAATISGIETINVRSVMAVTQIVTMAAPTNAISLNADRATDAIVFTGLANGAAIGSITGGAAVSGTFVAGVTTGAFNAQSGVTAGVITITANADNLMTVVNINSTGAANVLTSVGIATGTGVKTININATTNLTTGNITGMAAATTITVTGAATAVNLGALAANVSTVTATGLAAGGVTATIGAVAQVLTLGGGTNVITTGGVQTGAVTAGAGTADRLIVAAAADVAATPGAKFTGFEILQNDVAANLNASLVSGITSVWTNNATAGFTGLSATQAASARAIVTTTGSTFELANATGSSDVLNLTLENLTAAAAATVISATGLTITGIETLNVNVNSGISTAVATVGATGADQISFAAAANLKTLTASGAFSVGIDASANATGLTSINTSGITGSTAGSAIILGSNTGALVVTGSNNVDYITLATLGAGGSVTVNTGTGNDNIRGTQAQVAAATINGGGGTTDTLVLTDTATTIADNTFANVTGIERITLSNTTALTWVVGGYANSIATANGGALSITAASIAAAGTIAVDASGLGAGNSLTLSMTNTNGGANAVNITGSNTGADIISYTAATAAGLVTVSAAGAVGSTASKTVTLAGGVGTGSITTGAGSDTITVGATVTTIAAGVAADAITLAAADGVQQTFTLSAANQSITTAFDTITNFSTVVTNGDVLDFAGTVILTTAQLITGQAGWAVTTGGGTAGVATKSGATLADFITAFATSTTAGSVVFANGGHTYVGYSDGSASITTSDQMVQLVGVTGVVGITASATSVANNVSII